MTVQIKIWSKQMCWNEDFFFIKKNVGKLFLHHIVWKVYLHWICLFTYINNNKMCISTQHHIWQDENHSPQESLYHNMACNVAYNVYIWHSNRLSILYKNKLKKNPLRIFKETCKYGKITYNIPEILVSTWKLASCSIQWKLFNWRHTNSILLS